MNRAWQNKGENLISIIHRLTKSQFKSSFWNQTLEVHRVFFPKFILVITLPGKKYCKCMSTNIYNFVLKCFISNHKTTKLNDG